MKKITKTLKPSNFTKEELVVINAIIEEAYKLGYKKCRHYIFGMTLYYLFMIICGLFIGFLIALLFI